MCAGKDYSSDSSETISFYAGQCIDRGDSIAEHEEDIISVSVKRRQLEDFTEREILSVGYFHMG